MHLAGHTDCGTHIIDTHDQPVRPEVWDLFAIAWQRSNGASTLLEWDGNLPDFDTCHDELLKARRYMAGRFEHDDVSDHQPTKGDAVPNPVNFLVPSVIGSVQSLGQDNR